MRLPGFKFRNVEEDRQDTARKMQDAAWPDMFANLQSAYAELTNAQFELERRTVEIAETRDLFQQVVSSMTEALFLTDRSGRVIRANPAAGALLEYTEDSIIGHSLAVVCGTEDIPATPWKLLEIAPNGRLTNLDIDIRTASDVVIPVSFSMGLMRDKQEKITGVLAVARDMRETRTLINSLVAARTRFQELLEFAPDAVVLSDQDGRIVLVNTQTEKLFGCNRDDLLGQSVHMLIPADVPDIYSPDDDSIEISEGYASRPFDEGRLLEFYGRNSEGREFLAELTRRPVMTEDGLMIMTLIRDISERKRAESALYEAQIVRNAIVDFADYAIISTEQDGTVVTFNPAAEQMFGYRASELIGTRLPTEQMLYVDTHTLERAEEFSEELNEFLEPGFDLLTAKSRHNLPNEYEWTFVHTNGTSFPVSLSLTALRDAEGYITGFLGIANDISDRRRIDAERVEVLRLEQEARKTAEENNRLKDDFLAMISHELRAPLTAILGWAQMLRAGSLDRSSAERALLTIERNAKTQAHLVGDLLDASRIATGKLALDIKGLELMSIVESAVDAVRPSVEARNLRMQIVLEPWVGPFNGDAERLKQIVWNLLSNAIKFTPPGGLIEVRLEKLENKALLIVSDTGVGIEPEFLPHIFDRFRQYDSSTRRQQGGLGLGLAIVKHIVELHGGAIYAYSRGKDQGADFMITLPLALSSDGETVSDMWLEQLSTETQVRTTSLKGVKALVIDDDHDTREILSAMLSRFGTVVKTASSAAEAYDVLPEWMPDVIVSDIGMPGEDGFSLIRRIRQLPESMGGATPAVALTAFAGTHDKDVALESGFQKHLSKPVEPVLLAKVVAAILGRSEEGITL